MKDICRGDDEHFRLCLYSVCLKLFLKREKCNFDNLRRITCVPFPFLWGLITLIDTEQKIIVWMFIIAIIMMISVVIFLQPGQGRRDLFCSTCGVKLCGDVSEDREKC